MSTLAELDARARALESDLAQQRGRALALVEQAQAALARGAELSADEKVNEQAAAVLSKFADAQAEQVRRKLEGLVSSGLTAVFGEPLSLIVREKEVARRLEVELLIASEVDGKPVETPVLDSRGGGVAAVTGFLLSVVLIVLKKAPRILFLDETFAHVSAEYEPALAQLLAQLCESLGLQVVMVTHSTAYEEFSSTVYRTSIKGGRTQVERVK